jgi:hypothetical protein
MCTTIYLQNKKELKKTKLVEAKTKLGDADETTGLDVR